MVGSFFTMLYAKIAAVVSWFGLLFVAVFVAFWDLIKDAFSWLFDQVLGVAVSAITAIDVSGISGFSADGWGALPAELVNILGLLGLGTALGIIAAAISIRLALQLIPFVRLGS